MKMILYEDCVYDDFGYISQVIQCMWYFDSLSYFKVNFINLMDYHCHYNQIEYHTFEID